MYPSMQFGYIWCLPNLSPSLKNFKFQRSSFSPSSTVKSQKRITLFSVAHVLGLQKHILLSLSFSNFYHTSDQNKINFLLTIMNYITSLYKINEKLVTRRLRMTFLKITLSYNSYLKCRVKLWSLYFLIYNISLNSSNSSNCPLTRQPFGSSLSADVVSIHLSVSTAWK